MRIRSCDNSKFFLRAGTIAEPDAPPDRSAASQLAAGETLSFGGMRRANSSAR